MSGYLQANCCALERDEDIASVIEEAHQREDDFVGMGMLMYCDFST